MRISVTLQGVAPLLCNRFTEAAQLKATAQTGAITSHGKQDAPREQCAAKLYVDEKERPGIPGANLLSCITAAGTFFKAGKGKVTTTKTSLIPACVTIVEVLVPIKSEHGWSVDDRPVRNPATGGRFLCYRPRFDDWSLSFTIDLDETVLSDTLLRDIVDAAGKRIGLGDFRPSCKGPFGRFSVNAWKVEAKTKSAAA